MVVTDLIVQPGFAGRYPFLAVEFRARLRGLAPRVEACVHKGPTERVQ